MAVFLISNHAAQSTAAPTAVTTGTAIKTMLQILPATGHPMYIAEWGFSFNASALAIPIVVELITTAAVAATVTPHAESSITKLLVPSDALAANYLTLSTTGTGYTASAEGTVVTVRNLDAPIFGSVLSQPFQKQFPLGLYPVILPAQVARIRVTAGAAVNCYCYVKLATG